MAKTTKRKGGRSATDRKMADTEARYRKELKRQLRDQKEIARLSRAIERATRKADQALHKLSVFIDERIGPWGVPSDKGRETSAAPTGE